MKEVVVPVEVEVDMEEVEAEEEEEVDPEEVDAEEVEEEDAEAVDVIVEEVLLAVVEEEEEVCAEDPLANSSRERANNAALEAFRLLRAFIFVSAFVQLQKITACCVKKITLWLLHLSLFSHPPLTDLKRLEVIFIVAASVPFQAGTPCSISRFMACTRPGLLIGGRKPPNGWAVIKP